MKTTTLMGEENVLLYSETKHGNYYRVMQRKSGRIQIWVNYQPGQSAGYPECVYSGDIGGARKYWVTRLSK